MRMSTWKPRLQVDQCTSKQLVKIVPAWELFTTSWRPTLREDVTIKMIKRILAGSILAMVIVGCGGSGGSSGTSYVMGVNALPNVGTVSITANGTVALNNAGFAANASTFVGVNSGNNASIFLTNSTSTQLASGTTTFTAGDYYTAYALGNSVNQYVFIYPIDVSSPAVSSGRFIFVNASTLQPSVDVYVTLVGSAQGAPIITSMTPFNSGQESASLPVGTYDVQFKAAGTSTVLVDEPSVTIGTSSTTNEIQIVGITDSPTGSATAQYTLPVIPVPVVATASKPVNMGHGIVVGHPGMTSFPPKK